MKRFVALCAAAALLAAPALAAPSPDPEPVPPERTRETPVEQDAPPEGTGGSDPDAVTTPPPGTPPPPTEEDVGISTEPGFGGAGFESPEQDREVRRQPSSGPRDAQGQRQPGGADDGRFQEDLPDHQSGGELPGGVEEGGMGGSGTSGEPASDFEPVPDEDLRPATEDRSIMGNEDGSTSAPAADDATGGAADQSTDQERRRGAVFDTGDTSGRAPGTIPEGDEPGPGSPLPAPSELP